MYGFYMHVFHSPAAVFYQAVSVGSFRFHSWHIAEIDLPIVVRDAVIWIRGCQMNDNNYNSILVSFFLGRNLLGKDYATPNSCAVWRNKIAECYRRGSLHHSTVDTSYIYSLCRPMPTCLLKTVLVLADLASSLAQTGTGIKQSSCKQLALWLYEFCFASTLVTSSWLNSMAMCDMS